MSTYLPYLPAIAATACSRVIFSARQSTSGCQNTVRPTANPMKPAAQTGRLLLIKRTVPLRIVAHQHLGEGRTNSLDVASEILAIFEVEFFLAAFLSPTGGGKASGLGIPQDRRAELLIQQNPPFSLGAPPAIAAMKPS